MAKENKDEDLRLEVIFDSSNYGKVGCKIKIVDELAVATFSDRRLAKDMYLKEKELAIDDVYYRERLSALATKYPGLTKTEIAKKLMLKFKEHNIGVNERKK